jgi:hypothetical protein
LLSFSGTAFARDTQGVSPTKEQTLQQKCNTQKCLNKLAKEIATGTTDPNVAFLTLSKQQQSYVLQKVNSLLGGNLNTNRTSTIDILPKLGVSYNIQMPNSGTTNSYFRKYTSASLSTLCDNDPSDVDWLFVANTPASVYPSKMRWRAESAMGYNGQQVQAAFLG